MANDMDSGNGRVSVVVITRDRCTELLRTLAHLRELPERPPIIVVDNASTDETPAALRRDPDIRYVPLTQNLGATARNIGLALARTPYVAFADDDSWWLPGAFSAAERGFERHPRLGLLAARVAVGESGETDETSTAMAAAPLGREPDLPGPSVLGFMACGALVRKEAFLEVGGFDGLVFFGGEETLLALDLAAAGWGLAYVDGVVACHRPSRHRHQPVERRALGLRNDVLTCWMRRPIRVACRETARLAGNITEPAARSALLQLTPRLPLALSRRRRVPTWLERRVRHLAASRPPRARPDR